MKMTTQADRLPLYTLASNPDQFGPRRSTSNRRHRALTTDQVVVPRKANSVAVDIAGLLVMVACVLTVLGGCALVATRLSEMLSQASVFDLLKSISG